MNFNILNKYILILDVLKILPIDIRKIIVVYLPVNINDIVNENNALYYNSKKNKNINAEIIKQQKKLSIKYKIFWYDNVNFFEHIWLKYVCKTLPKNYKNIKFIDFRRLCINILELYVCNRGFGLRCSRFKQNLKSDRYDIYYEHVKMVRPLFNAIENDDLIKINILTKKMVYFDHFYWGTRNTKNALMVASGKNNINIVKILIDNGSNLNIVNNKNKTALIYALMNKNFDIAELLINNGADINIGNIAMPFSYNYEIAKFMITKKFNINCQNKFGNSPLALVLISNKLDIAHLLINNGACINHENYNNETILMFASKYCRANIVVYLLNNKVDINKQNKNGNTALYEAFMRRRNWKNEQESSYYDLIKFLKNNGSNQNLINKQGKNFSML